MNEQNSMCFKGKVVIVTGAARGIGAKTVELFNRQGALIIAQDINPLVKDLEKDDSIVSFLGDASSEKDAKAVCKFALERFGKLDVLINNAGKTLNKPFLETSVADWDLIMNTNAKGYFLHSREALKIMSTAGSGCIVNVASIVSTVGLQQTAAYSASKGAIAQLTKVTAIEFGKHGIRANAVAPGVVETDILEGIVENSKKTLSSYGEAHLLGRVAQPEEIANTILFLASPMASFITGSIVMADGGYTAI